MFIFNLEINQICLSVANMDGVLSEVPEGPEEVLPVVTANTEEVSKETADENLAENFNNGENSEDAPEPSENMAEPTIKTESDAPTIINGMDSNTSCSNSSGGFHFSLACFMREP